MIMEFINSKSYNSYKTNNDDFIDIRSRFGNGYTIRDNFNILTDEVIKKHKLIDCTGTIIDAVTNEEYKDHKRYYTDSVDSLVNENFKFIILII